MEEGEQIGPKRMRTTRLECLLGSDVSARRPAIDQEGRAIDVRRLIRREEERGYRLQGLDDAKQVKARAARLLGVSERSLWYKLRKHGLT